MVFAEGEDTPARLASGGANGSVVLYALKAGLPAGAEVPTVLETDHRSSVKGLAFSADGRTLLSVGADKTLWQ